jgi:release factor glutamine methyltransferase
MSEKLTILDIIERSTEYLDKKGVPNSKCDVEWIISHITQKGKLELYLDFGNFLEKEDLNEIRKCVISRGKRIPLQHVIGKVNFAGNDLICDKRALVPRPETEYFTELIRERIKKNFNGTILDLGTGSGAIIITLCIENQKCEGIGVDKSKSALTLAMENIKLHELNNVELKHFDWTKDNLDRTYDVIVSNPPYLSNNEWLIAQQEVKDYDPKFALVSEKNGISDIFYIIKHAEKNLIKDGLFALEIGIGQKDLITDKIGVAFNNIEIVKDFSQRERFLFAYKN